MSKYPSVFQITYTEQLTGRITQQLYDAYYDMHSLTKNEITGHSPNDQMQRIPPSMVNEWAATSAENLRKLILNYYREMGYFPE